MYRQSEKNLLSSNISPTCPYNMVNFGPLAAEIISLVWGTPANFNGFGVFAVLLHGTLLVGVSQTVALNRGRHLYSARRPSRWALAHISSFNDITLSASVQPALATFLGPRKPGAKDLQWSLRKSFQTAGTEYFQPRCDLPDDSHQITVFKEKCHHEPVLKCSSTTTPQLFYGPFSGTTWVSLCQKRTSGLYGARA